MQQKAAVTDEQLGWKRPALVFMMVGLMLASLVHAKVQNDYRTAIENYKKEASHNAHIEMEQINDMFGTLYRDLRTISMLPGVRKVDRHGKNFDSDARESIQQIYNSLHDSISISEIYIVPADLDPDKLDHATGHAQEPILMFDALIDGADSEAQYIEKTDDDEHQEYLMLREQMAWLRTHAPYITGDKLPMISSKSVLTCDRTHSNITGVEEDRKGIIFSVPFYDMNGRLKGTVSAIILNNALRALLNSTNYALISPRYQVNLSPPGGQDEASIQWVEKGEADPVLFYSEVIPLQVNDPNGQWGLWTGLPNSAFLTGSDMSALRMFRFAGYGAVLLVCLFGMSAWMMLQRNISQMKTHLTLEKAQREALATADAAQKASAAKGDFLANMSHELRTPMNGVLGMANLLNDTRLDEEQQQYVSTIIGSGENLLMLLNDILDFSKIEAGVLALERVAFELTDSFQIAINMLKLQAEKKQIALGVEYEKGLPQYVWGDPGRLRQIVINLVSNAIKFTQQGYVNVCVRQHEVGDGRYLHISVEDTGIGIPTEKLDSIFEKFTQADVSMTRKFGGTGLGLAISKHLVELMGGTMGVESVEGKGSTFWFSVPCHLAGANDIVVTSENLDMVKQGNKTKMKVRDARVLLVEDYPVNQVFAQKILTKFGFMQIDVAENGMEALQKYDEQPYDIIFMDCQMPELDGYLATQEIRIRELQSLRHTPIVAMTANAMMGDREKCLNAGMDDYLSKPLRMGHLKRALEAWFQLDVADIPEIGKRTTSSVDEPPVDMDQLRIFTNGDRAEEKELAILFIDQAQSILGILQENLADTKADAWKSAAHRFKGAAGNLGAMSFQHLCKRAETHSGDPEAKKREMLAAIQAETRRVSEFLMAV